MSKEKKIRRTYTMSKETVSLLERLAQDQDRKMSNIIKRALELYAKSA